MSEPRTAEHDEPETPTPAVRAWVSDVAPTLVVITATIYLVGFSFVRQNWSTLLIFVPVFVIAAVLGRLRSFAVTWVPLAVFLDAFARLRGLAVNTGVPIHHTAVLEVERHLFFGAVPTVWLQNRLTIPRHFRWYDYAATALHWSHFVMPITILFVLWLKYPVLFRRYLIAFIVLTTLVLDIYFLFPAAPPWMAAREGYLPHLARPMVDIAVQANRQLFGNVYATIGASNDVAAMPSLHASYPFLACVMFWPVSRKLGVLGLLYFLLMSLALVYLAEHYVIEILAAMICVLLSARLAYAIDRRLPLLPERRPIREPMHGARRIVSPLTVPAP
ncbi:MAG: phosphatase PAP2 family protein [Thermomicrobiales bacterium]